MRIVALTIFVGMSVACGDSGLTTTQPSPINAVDAARSLVVVQKGRNKAGPGGTCVFDPNDSGPDQCTPTGTSGTPPSGGRFKAGPGGTCVFDPNDSGPNQCTPAGTPGTPPSGGRFKAGPGGTCVFDPNDSGPNQCTP